MDKKGFDRSKIGQAFFDDIFLWFLLSLTLSFALYNIWALMEIMSLPIETVTTLLE